VPTWHYALDDDVDRGAVVAHALDQWGEHYAPLRQFLRSFCLPRAWCDRLRLPADVDGERWFCSELVYAALLAGGYRPSNASIPAAIVEPARLAYLDCLNNRGLVEKAQA